MLTKLVAYSLRWADQLKSINSVGELVHFNHPFLQATSMFVGEFSCMYAFFMFYFIFKRKGGEERVQASTLTGGNRNFNPFIFLPPAMCDMIATSTMYVGLNLTYASSFQMLRGQCPVAGGGMGRGRGSRVSLASGIGDVKVNGSHSTGSEFMKLISALIYTHLAIFIAQFCILSQEM